MFLIRTVSVKYIENQNFLVNEIFLYLNLKFLKNFCNQKSSLSIEELKSKGSDFFSLKWSSYYNYKSDVSVVIRNTVPNTNTQLKNVPNKNNLCKMYRKIFFLVNDCFYYLNMKISFWFRHQKCSLTNVTLSSSGWRQTELSFDFYC